MSKFLVGLLFISLFSACKNNPINQKLSATEFRIKAYNTVHAVILDVREKDEYDEGHLKGAINIPWNGGGFVETISSYGKETPIFLYCLTGGRSSPAAETMHKMGFIRIYEMDGGILKWRTQGFPQEGAVPKGMSVSDLEGLINHQTKMLVFFKANWNKNSQVLIPQIQSYLKEKNKDINLLLIDVDTNQHLIQTLKIDAIPTLWLYGNGKILWQYTGMPHRSILDANLK